MIRPLDFDKDKALNAAMETFWAKGYNAASLSDLTEAMELSKSSFYNSFGNKQELFLEVIDAYASAQAKALARLLGERRFRDGLNMLFDAIVNGNNDGKGCLLFNCAGEVALHDARAAARVREGFNEMARVFSLRAQRARSEGELDPAADPEILAHSLIAFVGGLRMLAKTGADRPTLRTVVRQTLDSLTGSQA
jgi:TetR/AcrR family transcriptional regulator, transcriptional repressor for nem operon